VWVLRSSTGPDADTPAFVFRVRLGSTKTIGRATRVDFVVDAPLVSRVHCRLEASRSGQLEVQDLRSTNGTFVNDRRVQHALLAPGDRLRVGRVELTITRETGTGTAHA